MDATRRKVRNNMRENRNREGGKSGIGKKTKVYLAGSIFVQFIPKSNKQTRYWILFPMSFCSYFNSFPFFLSFLAFFYILHLTIFFLRFSLFVLVCFFSPSFDFLSLSSFQLHSLFLSFLLPPNQPFLPFPFASNPSTPTFISPFLHHLSGQLHFLHPSYPFRSPPVLPPSLPYSFPFSPTLSCQDRVTGNARANQNTR